MYSEYKQGLSRGWLSGDCNSFNNKRVSWSFSLLQEGIDDQLLTGGDGPWQAGNRRNMKIANTDSVLTTLGTILYIRGILSLWVRYYGQDAMSRQVFLRSQSRGWQAISLLSTYIAFCSHVLHLWHLAISCISAYQCFPPIYKLPEAHPVLPPLTVAIIFTQSSINELNEDHGVSKVIVHTQKHADIILLHFKHKEVTYI